MRDCQPIICAKGAEDQTLVGREVADVVVVVARVEFRDAVIELYAAIRDARIIAKREWYERWTS